MAFFGDTLTSQINSIKIGFLAFNKDSCYALRPVLWTLVNSHQIFCCSVWMGSSLSIFDNNNRSLLWEKHLLLSIRSALKLLWDHHSSFLVVLIVLKYHSQCCEWQNSRLLCRFKTMILHFQMMMHSFTLNLPLSCFVYWGHSMTATLYFLLQLWSQTLSL